MGGYCLSSLLEFGCGAVVSPLSVPLFMLSDRGVASLDVPLVAPSFPTGPAPRRSCCRLGAFGCVALASTPVPGLRSGVFTSLDWAPSVPSSPTGPAPRDICFRLPTRFRLPLPCLLLPCLLAVGWGASGFVAAVWGGCAGS